MAGFQLPGDENNWCLDYVPHLICKYQTFIASVLQELHGYCVCKIFELSRLKKKLNAESEKPRTSLVTLQTQTAVNLILAENTEHMGKLKKMNIFLSRALSLED